jgi:hypothetical protein
MNTADSSFNDQRMDFAPFVMETQITKILVEHDQTQISMAKPLILEIIIKK